MPPINTNIVLAIGLAAGFALLNLLLGVAWLVCLRHSREARRQLAKTLPPDIEKHPSVLKRKRPPQAHRAQSYAPRARPDIRDGCSPMSLTHCEAIPYLTRDRYTPSPRMHPKKARAARTMSPLVPLSDARRERNGPPVHRHSRLAVPRPGRTPRIARTGSEDTFDTASIYSTVSAPRELHEQILGAQTFSRGRVGVDMDMAEQAPPAYPNATRPSIAPYALEFVELLAPETYDKTLAHRRGQLPPPATPVRMPRRPQPASTPEMSRTRSYFHPTSRFSITPPPLEPDHLRTSLDPPSPLARKFTPFLYRESSRQTLPSPHSPGPI